jgi:hypothetical protein
MIFSYAWLYSNLLLRDPTNREHDRIHTGPNYYRDVKMLEKAKEYSIIPPNFTYIAFDKDGNCLAAVFHEVYDDLADEITTTTITKIEQIIPHYNSSPAKKSHSHWEEWKRDNPHLQNVTTVSLGYWESKATPTKAPKSLTTSRRPPQSSQEFTSYCNGLEILQEPLMPCSVPSTTAHNIALLRHEFPRTPEYSSQHLPTANSSLFVFSLGTYGHSSTAIPRTGNWAGRGLPCSEISPRVTSALRRRVAFPSGAILGIRGGAIEHWITKWKGRCRYHLVHTIHQSVRQWFHATETKK